MRDDLEEQLETYGELLSELKRNHGEVWALIADKKLVSIFSEFSDAANYAVAHLEERQILIRHTGERHESAPFVHVEV